MKPNPKRPQLWYQDAYKLTERWRISYNLVDLETSTAMDNLTAIVSKIIENYEKKITDLEKQLRCTIKEEADE